MEKTNFEIVFLFEKPIIETVYLTIEEAKQFADSMVKKNKWECAVIIARDAREICCRYHYGMPFQSPFIGNDPIKFENGFLGDWVNTERKIL